MERVCFLLRVRPDRLDEYRARHRAVWPEMLDALARAGWRNYSLFLRDDGLLVGYLETDDFARGAGGDGGDGRQRALAGGDGAVLRAPRRAPTPGSSASRRSSTLTDAPAFAAIDLGAESGRVVSGRLAAAASSSTRRTASRTGPCGCRTGCAGTCCTCSPRRSTGCAAPGAAQRRRRRAGASTTRCSTARGRVLGLPFHYRDERTAGMVERAYARVPGDELYATTGIQTMPINTVFQLLADEGCPRSRPPSGSRSCPTCSRSG